MRHPASLSLASKVPSILPDQHIEVSTFNSLQEPISTSTTTPPSQAFLCVAPQEVLVRLVSTTVFRCQFPYIWQDLWQHPNLLSLRPEVCRRESNVVDIDVCMEAEAGVRQADSFIPTYLAPRYQPSPNHPTAFRFVGIESRPFPFLLSFWSRFCLRRFCLRDILYRS